VKEELFSVVDPKPDPEKSKSAKFRMRNNLSDLKLSSLINLTVLPILCKIKFLSVPGTGRYLPYPVLGTGRHRYRVPYRGTAPLSAG
jgi:hypothetical protein